MAGSKLWVHSSFPQAATSYTCHNETVQSLQVATAANPSSTAFPVAPLHRCTVAASRRNDNCWGHESFGRLSPVNLPSFCISSWAQLLPCLSFVQFLRSSRSTLSTTYNHDASTRRTRVAYIQVVGARPSCTALSQTDQYRHQLKRWTTSLYSIALEISNFFAHVRNFLDKFERLICTVRLSH